SALFLLSILLFQIYGQGSGPDCRHHVQKLNLLQGEAEEAIGRTPRCVEEYVYDSKNTAAQYEDGSVQQEGRAEVSRWSKYLEKDSEDQEDGKEEADTERQQFCSWRKNTMKEQRIRKRSFLSSDVQEYTEENGGPQLAYQAKKCKNCVAAVADQDDGDALSGDDVVPAVCEPVMPENTQAPTACTKPSKWEKFLSCAGSCSKNAAGVTLSPREGSGRLGLRSSTAADDGAASGCSEQAGRTLGTGFEFKKYGASTSCSVEDDALFKAPQGQLIRAGYGGSETTAGRCCLGSMSRANTIINANTRPKASSNISCEKLFCTGEEFDDDL
ncbi:MRNIP protein, partial [Rostratula benghalensis]|nr:MRNIP protein [Rostratula benghalensis]